ncbi:nuclear inhibitor of protein phosphatase 1 [Lingula anatina]|uniref:Nuclear inhibitor of protein phosphatase 1 n=1 Tax=Lingula anatina TaxID=7574 RepID=A0A1S3JJS4_LINAN|nr:nuclear inhibitor of protein phosphatase 1 [Lingula anatina]|eukprot:XP_013410623.1 nuclear inhibitor of protein phosphatase 1 [Lingula anatina]
MATVNANNFEVPTWAGKPPPGLHLDVLKEGKMIQKLMIDEKKCYFFGRNKQLCDFCIDHASCSRVHAALVWHKHLGRPFIIDLGSTHGTFIGHIRLDLKKPQQVPIDSELHFGASSRVYIIRERPQMPSTYSDDKDKTGEEIGEGGLLGLPESETELENLTEFNTAHNRRIAAIGDIADVPMVNRKRRRKSVGFREEDEVINPEDIDPTVGRFRNMISTMVIPSKKPKLDAAGSGSSMFPQVRQGQGHFGSHLYSDLPSATDETGLVSSTYSIATKLGLPVPNLAPDLEEVSSSMLQIAPAPAVVSMDIEQKEPKKKKYAKEAWPGKRPTPALLV